MKKKLIIIISCLIVLGMTILSFVADPISSEMPEWISVIPPLVAIAMALISKEVISSLFIGIFSGTFILSLYSGAVPIKAFFSGMFSAVDTYVVQAIRDQDHIMIIVFTLIIGGMVRLVSINGGMRGIVNWLSKKATTSRSGQLITFILGIIIFFDDYANTIVVGNTMRPVTDKLKISREKLAYIVDSSSAPVVAVAFVTTWIGAELSYIQNGIDVLGLDVTAYSVFLKSLAYSFYPLLTLIFMFMIIVSKRDFGPMLSAERIARQNADENFEESSSEKDSARAIDALLPLSVLIFGTIAGLVITGYDSSIVSDKSSFMTKMSAVIGNSNSFLALMWASLLSLFTAIVMTVIRGKYKFTEVVEESIEGFKTMFMAVLILTMAWSISLLTENMHTAEFISQLFVRWSVMPTLVPAISFVLAFLIGFSTGTSWGTMAILYPLILPTTWILSQNSGLDADTSMRMFYIVVSTVLSGAVFGDHCSPISDTTVMSSTASQCNHISHVRTQIPYAMTVGAVSLLIGIIPVSFGAPSWIAFLMAAIIMWFIIRFVGKKV